MGAKIIIPETCSGVVLAELLGLTPTRIQQLVQLKVFSKVGRGRYELKTCVHAYVKFLKGDSDSGPSSDLHKQKLRFQKLKADKAALENLERQKELVPTNLVDEVLKKVGVIYSSSLEGLPGRFANELAGINNPAEIRSRLLAEVRRIRNHTGSVFQQFGTDVRVGEEHGGDSQSSDASNASQVGGGQQGTS